MSIKVIKHGKETFKAVCPICGCEFTYQSEDLKEDCFHNHYVDCPDCKQAVSHEYEAKKKSLEEDLTWKFPKPGEPIPCDKKDKWFYVETPFVSPFTDWPDCDKCPNKPSWDKTLTIGDTPCTWCKKNLPYCYTGDVFPKDYKGGSYKVVIDPEQYKNTGYTNTSLSSSAFTTNYTTEEK